MQKQVMFLTFSLVFSLLDLVAFHEDGTLIQQNTAKFLSNSVGGLQEVRQYPFSCSWILSSHMDD